MSDKKSNDSRRKLLKSIAAGSSAVVAAKSLPESWAKPVVDSVVLPVHALTSETPTIECSAEQGCYNVTEINGNSVGGSLFWPGGTGPQSVDIFFSNDVCRDTPDLIAPGVVAQNTTEAESLLSCTGGSFTGEILEITTDPAIPNCKFYTCEVDT